MLSKYLKLALDHLRFYQTGAVARYVKVVSDSKYTLRYVHGLQLHRL